MYNFAVYNIPGGELTPRQPMSVLSKTFPLGVALDDVPPRTKFVCRMLPHGSCDSHKCRIGEFLSPILMLPRTDKVFRISIKTGVSEANHFYGSSGASGG